MVRHKSRWLLVDIVFSSEEQAAAATTIEQQTIEQRKHLYHALRIMIDSAFGIAGSGITEDIQGT